MKSLKIFGVAACLFCIASLNAQVELQESTPSIDLNKRNIESVAKESVIDVVLCNGESKFIELGFTEHQLLSVKPTKESLVFENEGVWLNVKADTKFELEYQHSNQQVMSVSINVGVETIEAAFSLSSSEGTSPMNVNLRNESKNALEYKWDIGFESSNLENPSFTFSDPGLYQIKLTVRGENGCWSLPFTKDVEVFAQSEFFIPNAFTPNFDGRNETFFVTPKNVEAFTCVLFNQHGDKIATIGSVEESWDGTFNGYPAPSGNYIYKISYTNLAGEAKKLVGAVELRR